MQEKTYQFSPSMLNLHAECPKCFWLHYNKGLKRPKTPFPSLPNGMDSVLKNFYDSFLEKEGEQLPPEISSIPNIRLFADKQTLDVWRNNFVGIRTKDEFGNTIMGAVDAVLQNTKTDELIILDYKTRATPPNGNSYTYYVNQLTMYAWLLEQNGYKVSSKTYLLFYYPDTVIDSGVITFKSELVPVEIETARANAIIAKARTCLSKPEPPSSNECEFCNWLTKREKAKQANTQKTLFDME